MLSELRRLDGNEALAMLLFRLSYPGRYMAVRNRFGRSTGASCRIILGLTEFLESRWNHLIYFNVEVYRRRRDTYCQAISETVLRDHGVRIDDISLFIDGTRIGITRPGAKAARRQMERRSGGQEIQNADAQRVCYSRHKRKHCLSFQDVNCPDGT
jgi:hypothetical protein